MPKAKGFRCRDAADSCPRGDADVYRWMTLLVLLLPMAGCPQPFHPDTPVDPRVVREPTTDREYWLYLPSYYSDDRDWPLVVTLHGTFGWDSARAQVAEWKYVAEEKGFIVAAPKLRSVQGIIPVVKSWWYKDLEKDERMILATIDDLRSRYRVDEKAVLLTGFSAGGYPLYHAGLRNPTRFNMLIARACNSDIGLFERLDFTDQTRTLPVAIYWGKDDLKAIRDQSWQAFEYLRRRECFATTRKQVKGGHLRRPELAYRLWLKHLPRKYHKPGL